DEFISRMPLGYDSMVGERGETLSGGQRQRISIARAVIRNSPILVLDEPTAALDAESEHLVIEALRRLMKGRTVIMIAHRLSTLVDADKIIVLKDGVVVEEGTYAALIARGGTFAELHRIQYQPAPHLSDAAGTRKPQNVTQTDRSSGRHRRRDHRSDQCGAAYAEHPDVPVHRPVSAQWGDRRQP